MGTAVLVWSEARISDVLVAKRVSEKNGSSLGLFLSLGTILLNSNGVKSTSCIYKNKLKYYNIENIILKIKNIIKEYKNKI